MPHDTEFEDRGVLWRFFGEVNFAEIMEVNREVWESGNWDRCRYQIVNFLGVDSLDLCDDQAIAVAYIDKAASQTVSQMKVAIVADRSDVVELCEAYIASLNTEGWEARIFDNMAAAAVWAKS